MTDAAAPNPPVAQPAIDIAVFGGADPLFSEALRIRVKVFVEEQAVPADEEPDAQDAVATHLLLRIDGAPAGTLRFYDDAGWLHVGRVAVLKEYRSFGVGRRLMERCLAEGRRRGLARSFLNSQTHAESFYRHFGYRSTGDIFYEAGIPHHRMEADL